MRSTNPSLLDLLCIPGSDFYDYGVKIRKIAADQEFTRIRFRRLADVLGIADGDSLPKDEYIALADTCRAEMEARFLPDQSEMKEKIENHKDTNLTYQAYVKLTDEDLRWGPDLDPAIKNNRERYTEETKKVAVKMTERLLVSLHSCFRFECWAHNVPSRLMKEPWKLPFPITSGFLFIDLRANPRYRFL